MNVDEVELVRIEYAREDGLRARRSVYGDATVNDLTQTVLGAIGEVSPERVLEVGCGWGDFAVRVRDELGAEIVAIDLSPRMVELAREQGLDALVADVVALPFREAEFDCVTANWMLYHVADLDRALAEIGRVLRPGGRLVAATSSHDHLRELWRLVGRDRSTEPPRFFAETGAASLARHFSHVERRDLRSEILFPDADAVRGYITASVAHKHLADRVPEFEGSLTATCANAIFVAETAV